MNKSCPACNGSSLDGWQVCFSCRGHGVAPQTLHVFVMGL